MADYSTLPAATTTTYAVPTTTTYHASPNYVVRSESRGASTVAWIALVLAIILIIAVIILGIMYFRNRNIFDTNPPWVIAPAITTGTTDTFAPAGDNIYISRNPASFTLSISKPSTPTTGRMFEINNTNQASSVLITVRPATGSGISITDNISSNGTVEGRTTAQYIWTSETTIVRLR
jgi:hypothetical protein